MAAAAAQKRALPSQDKLPPPPLAVCPPWDPIDRENVAMTHSYGNGRRPDDNKALAELRFQIGDYLDVAILWRKQLLMIDAVATDV